MSVPHGHLRNIKSETLNVSLYILIRSLMGNADGGCAFQQAMCREANPCE
jgi:hypothetical protein